MIPTSGLPDAVIGTVVTVGTFDGIHLGHQALFRAIAKRALERGVSSLLLTFEPHPLQVLRPKAAPLLLTTVEEKKEIFAQVGVDYVAFVPFTQEFSKYTPKEFVEEVLVRRLRARELVIGHDHSFGRNREGNVDVLEELGDTYGFDVHVVHGIEMAGEPISSTRIRDVLLEGDVESAIQWLGRPYSVSGRVIRGEGRGQALGFPTANLMQPPENKLLPAEGIYVVRASLGSKLFEGLLHLGPRPTFSGTGSTIELFLIDFSADIYGQHVVVEFLTRIREVRSFASSTELVDQMHEDLKVARRFFKTLHKSA